MQFTNPFPSLLGMNNQEPDPYQTLLGGYYTPQQARMAWLGGTLQGVGAGLASGKAGAWAQGAALGGGEGLDNYRQRAVVANGIAMQKQEYDYQQQQRQEEAAARQAEEEAQAAAIAGLPPEMQTMAKAFPNAVIPSYVKNTYFPDAQGGSGGGLGMTPIPLSNGQGGWAVGQLSPNGGVMINGRPAGPEWKYDPYGLSADKSKGTTVGKGKGNVELDFESLNSKLPGLEIVVNELSGLANEATYTGVGQARDWLVKETGNGPTAGALARTKYEAMVSNQVLPLLRDTFGAQFTLQEGENLRKTLGDPNKTPPEKQAVLEAFIEQKMRDLDALRMQAGGGAPIAPPPPNSSVEEWELGPDGRPRRKQ